MYGSSSYPDYVDLRDSGALESLAAHTPVSMALDANGQAEPVTGEMVSGNYFDVLGVAIPVGRAFAPDEDRAGTPVRVAVISHALWQRVFNGDPSLIGRTIRLNGNPYTVNGVAPSGFYGPILGRAPEVWVPMALQPEVSPPSAPARRARGHARTLEVRSSRGLEMIGRLPADGSLGRAATVADVIAGRLRAENPVTNRNRGFTVAALGEGRGVRVSSRPMLRLLAAAVAIVLLIACANVASLLLVRAVSRQREVAVRVAIGAGRARLVRQWLAESLLLAALGSAGALLIAWWGTPVLHTFGIPETVDLSINPRVLGFMLVVAVGTGLLFGMAPVLQTLRHDTITALRADGGTVATGARGARMRNAFVVAQVALSLVLLVGAGLFLRYAPERVRGRPGVRSGPHIDRPARSRRPGVFGTGRPGGLRTDSVARGRAAGCDGGRRGTHDGAHRRRPLDGRQHRRPPHSAGQQQRPRRPRQHRQPALPRRDEHSTSPRPIVRGLGHGRYAEGDCREPIARGPALAERRSHREDAAGG